MKQKLSKLKYRLTGVIIGVFAVTLIIFSVVAYYTDSSSQNVNAATNGTDNVTGWLNITGDKNSDGSLEQTFGWQSLDSSNPELSNPNQGNYGLEFEDVSQATTNANGLVTELELKSGEGQYLWSSNLGWVNFNPKGTPPNVAGYTNQPGVKYVNSDPENTMSNGSSGGKLTGWARACSVYESGCSGAKENTDQLGGFDGWIKLSDANYQPRREFNQFYGFAWGGPTIGWVDFGEQDSTFGSSNYKGFRFTKTLGNKASRPEFSDVSVTGGEEQLTIDWTFVGDASNVKTVRVTNNWPGAPSDTTFNATKGSVTLDAVPPGLSPINVSPEIKVVNVFGDTSKAVQEKATVEPPSPSPQSCTAFPKTAEKDTTVRVSATVDNIKTKDNLDNWRIASGLRNGDSVAEVLEKKDGNTVTGTLKITFTHEGNNQSQVGKRQPEVKVDVTGGSDAGTTLTFSNCEDFTYFGSRQIEEVQP